MNTALLKQLGSIEQLAGIREARLLRGRGEGVEVAEFYNAAGLRFTVVPELCMDIYDLSYQGVNFSFQTKNGLTSPLSSGGGHPYQWPGGMLFTCGLDNVGSACSDGGSYPTHGRIGYTPAQSFGTETRWEKEDYILRASGEMHQTRLYGAHLSLRRTVETGLYDKTLRIRDEITNFEAADEPYMLLYHFNFGYPLLQSDSVMAASPSELCPMSEASKASAPMPSPRDSGGGELYFRTGFGPRAYAVIYNERLELGAYISFDTENLPNLLQWKNIRSHDYVQALEPSNTCGLNRVEAIGQNKIAVLPAYSTVENRLELGVLDGMDEIRSFLKERTE